MQTESDRPPQASESPRPPRTAAQPDYNRPIRPIAELLSDPAFPKSALGEFVDIGGYTGVVTELVNQSLKVRSTEGVTKSFNANGLRRIYGPVVHPDPMPSSVPEPVAVSVKPARAAAPVSARSVTVKAVAPPPPPAIEPNFEKPVVAVQSFLSRGDYPQCLLGEHVEIGDYSGVVVQIIGRSLKVRAATEITRSYNADALRKLYGH